MQEINKKSEKSQLNEETRDSLVLNNVNTQTAPRRSRSRSPIDQAPENHSVPDKDRTTLNCQTKDNKKLETRQSKPG